MKFISKSKDETAKIGRLLGLELLKKINLDKRAFVIALNGELGVGKTIFVQGLASGLKIKDKILSPTFIIFKKFDIKEKNSSFKYFYHIDCYRIAGPEDLAILGIRDILNNPHNLVVIEWAGRVKKILPREGFDIGFKWLDENKRQINIISR